MRQIVLKLHIYAGLLAFAQLMIYGIAGLAATVEERPRPKTVQSSREVSYTPPASKTDKEVADDVYQTINPNEKDVNGNPLNGQKMVDVIMDLAKKVQKKHAEGVKTGKYPTEDEIADPQLVDEANVVTATPIDRVYEHGFYPLQGGFRANVQKNYEIFDQWLEILPTDQVVPVEVKYDPKTGRQV